MTNEKRCAIPTCGKILEPREYEWPKQFQLRKTCNRKCSRDLISWRAEQQKPHRKKCEREGCDVIRVQPEGQTTSHFNAVKFCEDHRRPAKIKLPPKICKVCGAEFTKNKTESNPQYEKRLTCGKFCGHKLPRPGRKRPLHKCALARCDVMIPKRRKYCTRQHCGEDQRVPVEVKAARKRETRRRRNEKRSKQPKKEPKPRAQPRRRTTKIVNNSKPVIKPKNITVFGDREPDYIWRPEALGGPVKKNDESEAS